MFSKIKYLGIVALFSTAFYSCSNDIAAPETSAGSADFSKYVAVGNSITSGYTSSGMTAASQENSLANLLAKQFKEVGGGDFKQPTMTEKGSGVLELQGLNLVAPCNVDTKPVIARSEVDANWATDISANGPFNNLAVPGMSVKSSDQVGYALPSLFQPAGNGFMLRMLSNDNFSYKEMVTEQVSAISPTFFTYWLGNNDVLTYAATGGGYLPNFSTNSDGNFPSEEGDYSTSLLAPPSDDDFRNKYAAILDILTANGAKGVVATLPDITALPYFTTVGNQVTNPNSCTDKLDVWITARSGSETTIRKATSNDLILLPAGSTIGRPDNFGGNIIPHGLSEYNPLRSAEVIDQQEIAFIKGKLDLYNNIIKQEAANRNVPVVDMYTFLNSLKDGGVYDGVAVSSAFISGGAFSLDGIHPSDRGYAIVANEFINTINSAYGAKIPKIDITKFKGVTFP